MHRFKYKYKNVVYESTMEYYMQDFQHRYRVALPNGLRFVIAKFGMSPPNTRIIWLQSNKDGEIVQPHDLVRAIGEGLEEYKLNKPDLR